jgi:5-methylcytosine-specific restriction endonuclease McrA
MNERFCADFIERCEEFAKPYLKEYKDSTNKWKIQNPEKYKALIAHYGALRREKKAVARAILSPQERQDILDFYKNRHKGYEVDHIIPISKGGSHTLDNLQYLNKSENRKKNAKWIGVFDGETYEPNFLLKRLQDELDENERHCAIDFNN